MTWFLFPPLGKYRPTAADCTGVWCCWPGIQSVEHWLTTDGHTYIHTLLLTHITVFFFKALNESVGTYTLSLAQTYTHTHRAFGFSVYIRERISTTT